MTDLDPDPIDRALENLSRVAVPVEESTRAARRRDRVVGVLGSVLGRVRARRTFARRAWFTFVPVMAAGLVLLAIGVFSKWNEAPNAAAVTSETWHARLVVGNVAVRTANGARRAIASGETFQPGDSIEAEAGGSVSLGLTSGDVRLVSAGRVDVVSTTTAERRLRVALGSLEVDLPRKLPHGQALIMETPDAQVRVVGTAFRVDVSRDASGQPTTAVSVRRGTVWVMQRGERRATLGAGTEWRSRPEVALAVATPTRDVARTETHGSSARSARTPEAQGTLAEENRLYEAALAARNVGDDRRAAEGFGQLLSRYPRSVLGEQSLAERFRALDRAGQVSLSVAAARRYLAAYPDGFARADAERIVKR
jgi:hypothetical protein